jgi:predicted glycosyltransferase
MRFLIDVNHPAHVHVFRCAARAWREAGHEVLFTATDKDVVRQLLAEYDLPHRVIYKRRAGKLYLALELLARTAKLIVLGLRFRPDVWLSVGSPTAAFSAFILRQPHLSMEDTEDSIGQIRLYRPFTTLICVPSCFMRDLGPKMRPYAGYHELAYLHPKRFIPDPLKIAPLSSDERYFVVRFIAWDASHDQQAGGFSAEGKQALLDFLLSKGRVVLSVEKNPPLLLGRNGQPECDLPASAMHHFLAFAELYVGEGVTAASEAAVLGTPSLLINTREVGYILEEQNVYSLVYLLKDEASALAKLKRMLAQPDLKNVWRSRREVLLRDKIDVSAWLATTAEALIKNK